MPPAPPALFISPLSSPYSSRKYAELDADTSPSSPDGSPSKRVFPPTEEGRRGSPTLEEILPSSYLPSSLHSDFSDKVLDFEDEPGSGDVEDASLIHTDSNIDNIIETAVLTSVSDIDNNIAGKSSPS
jgi:hypothetical protein